MSEPVDRVELGSGWQHRSGCSAVVVGISRNTEDGVAVLLIDGRRTISIPLSGLLDPGNSAGDVLDVLDGWSPA